MLMKIGKRQQQGIGLLELMLSLAIISVLLVMAARYFAGTRTAQQVTATLAAVTELVAANTRYFSDNNSYPATIDALLTPTAYIPVATSNNPWSSGKISLTGTSSSYTITISNISNETICQSMADKITGSTLATLTASCSSTTLTVTGG